MEIDKKKCVGCGNFYAVCTMGVIYLDEDGKSVVNQDECVECFTCYWVLRDEGHKPWFVRTLRRILFFFPLGYLAEVDVCPTGALTPPQLGWPRSIRAVFSDPTTVHPSTGVMGSGTDEIKTNDVTGKLRKGDAGLVIEMGRHGIGAYFRDIEMVKPILDWGPIIPRGLNNDEYTPSTRDIRKFEERLRYLRTHGKRNHP